MEPLSDYWRSLAPGAEKKRDLAPPVLYEPQWLVTAGLGGAAALGAMSGAWVLAGLLVVGTGGSGWWLRRRLRASEAELAAWEADLYCRHCPRRFAVVEAVEKVA